MYQSKLFTLLRGIDPSEMRWLHKFLKSPFYNTNQQYLQLFEYIKKYHPDLDSPKLTKEAAHKKLFPKEKFNVQRMRKMMHELTVLVEDFMVAQHFHNDQKARKKVLTEELGRRNIYALFEKGIEEQRAALEAQPHRNEAYFLEQFELREDLFGHPSTVRQKDAEGHLLALSEDLDRFYFLKKLAIGVSLESAKNIYSIESELPFFEEILEEIEERELGDVPAIRLYVLVYQLFKNKEDEKLFKELYDLFLEKKDELDLENREMILRLLINYATFQRNKGKTEFIKFALILYKLGIKDGLLIKNNRLSENIFVNITSFATILKEIEWVKIFINEHIQCLENGTQNEALKLSLANLYFSEEKFEQVIELLRDVIFDRTLYKLISRTLLLKCYFELFLKDESYYELIFSQIETYDRYVRREHKISESNKIGFQNFGRYLKKLIAIYWQKLEIDKFEEEISPLQQISNKAWLIEKSRKIREGIKPSLAG